ncbi:hypothetical protein [Aeromonas veronii]|uniref:hypothetical protein n=1 Tax=Aeromonas veronii TaxID=654 RepID=UPI0029D98E74|nr:hypothetical protein [Aeromonas veronii]MDX7877691.1 hypothetical protein [Aeromonas veronii]
MIENEGYKMADRLPLVISFLSVYILVSGTSYMLGFWALFPLSIFDYIGVVDIAKSSIPGLMISVLVVSSQYVFRVFMHGFSNELSPVEESKTRMFIIKYKKIILTLLTFLPTCLYAFIDSWPSYVIKYHELVTLTIWFVALLGAFAVYIYFFSKGYTERLNSKKYIFGATVITLVFVTISSFAVGFGKSANILDGVRYSYVLSGDSASDINVSEQDRYIGYYGGKYFLWDPIDRLVKVSSSDTELRVVGFYFEPLKKK